MAQSLVSVVMPAYNSEKYIGLSIESILAQTMGQFEFLIVDDGSTDSTLQIINQYARRDSRIIILPQRNAGVAAARNRGIREAGTDLIAFLDNDDLAVPQRLAWQVQYLTSHPGVGVLGGAMEEIDSLGLANGFKYFPPEDSVGIQQKLETGSPLVFPTIMARRTCLLSHGGLRQQFAPSDDYDLWLRIRRQIQFANLREVLVQYRVYPAAQSRTSILHYALTTPAAQAAARLRQAGQADPADGVPTLTPDVLQALGIGETEVGRLQARALMVYACKMFARGETEAANELLQQVGQLTLDKSVRIQLAPEVLFLSARMLSRRGEYLEAARVLVKGFVNCPGLASTVCGKAWRFARRTIENGVKSMRRG